MNSHDQEKLLKGILPPDDAAEFRQASLECGLAGLRRERRRHHLVKLSVAAAIFIGLSLGVVLNFRNAHPNQNAQIQPAVAATSPALAAHVDFINDEQLLALVTNKPVALIGKPGDQHLVYLGKSEDDSAEHQF